MYRLCIFDLDGTLADTLLSIEYSVNKTLKEFGFEAITGDQCRQFIGEGARLLMERSLRAAGDEKLHKIEPVYKRYLEIFDEYCTYKAKPFEGMVPALLRLKEMGVKLSVLSNKPHDQAGKVVEDIFGPGLFDVVRGQRPDCKRKPDPAGALLLAEQFQVKPLECLYIGDTDTDMITGCRAGMCTVGVAWGYRPEELLIESGAKHIIYRPDELLELAGQETDL